VNGVGETPAVTQPPNPKTGIVVVQPEDLEQVYFTAAWPAPAYTSPDRYAWHILASLYGGGPNSRLYRVLREEKGLVYHIDAQYQAYGDTGVLVVEGATLPQTLVPVLAGILIELFRLGTEELSPDDRHRVTQSMISQHLVSGDSAYVRMSRLALQEYYFGKLLSSDEVTAGLREQTEESIHQAAQSALAGGLPAIALVGPISEAVLNGVGEMLSQFGETPTLSFAPQRTMISSAV
jgi:predicted Zn-dependent peptidase